MAKRSEWPQFVADFRVYLQVLFNNNSVFQAQQILSTCLEKIDISSTEGYDVFLSQLKDGLKNTSHETAANHKVAKVNAPASLLTNEHTRLLIGRKKIMKHH